jgi:transcriptional regulator with XRE-family HTH domain
MRTKAAALQPYRVDESKRLALSTRPVIDGLGMPKISLPETANALWKWMELRRVTCDEFATLIGCTRQHVSDIRRGIRRPSDTLKEKIASKSLEVDRKASIKRPRGVPVAVWYAS